MDFGKILNQWDSRQASARRHARERHTQHDKVSHKKPNAPSLLRQSQVVHECADVMVAERVLSGSPSASPSSGRYTDARDNRGGHPRTRRCVSVPDTVERDAIRAVQEKWIHSHVTFDKDAIADEEAEEKAERSIKYIKSMRPDARLDLHGYTQKEAWNCLSNFIDDCMRRGARKVLIIHGKGIHAADSEGVLSSVVRAFIEMDSRCGRSGHPDRKHGGSGATWVMLKR